jgi:hypothetical protein
MAEIINLNKARKVRDRAKAKAQAEQNRVAFGRTKAEMEQAEAERARHNQVLDGVKRDRPDGPSDADQTET